MSDGIEGFDRLTAVETGFNINDRETAPKFMVLISHLHHVLIANNRLLPYFLDLNLLNRKHVATVSNNPGHIPVAQSWVSMLGCLSWPGFIEPRAAYQLFCNPTDPTSLYRVQQRGAAVRRPTRILILY